MLWKVAKFGISFLIMTIVISPLGCAQQPEYRRIDLQNLEPAVSTYISEPPAVTFRVAGEGVLSPIETLKSLDPLLSYLSQQLHQPVELLQRRSYAETNDLIRSGYVDLAFVCGLPYVAGHKEFGMELLVVPEVNGDTVYYSYIIVPADSDAENLKDLRGRSFAFADPLSNSGRLAPTYLLYQMEETPDNFFKEYTFSYSHENSIRAVAEGLTDGAAVDSLVYDYLITHEPAIKAHTKIIDRSGPFGIPPVVINPALNQEIKARLRGLFLNMHQDDTGKEALRSLMIDRFVMGDDSAYDTIRNMARELGW
jgi:phosphonate transport system substrate-binding protein